VGPAPMIQRSKVSIRFDCSVRDFLDRCGGGV
jgi:hypothetical protein